MTHLSTTALRTICLTIILGIMHKKTRKHLNEFSVSCKAEFCMQKVPGLVCAIARQGEKPQSEIWTSLFIMVDKWTSNFFYVMIAIICHKELCTPV